MHCGNGGNDGTRRYDQFWGCIKLWSRVDWRINISRYGLLGNLGELPFDNVAR